MVDPTIATELMSIINETYRDRVESIVSAETRPAPGFDGDDLFVVALDGRKQLAIRINETRPTNDQIAIKLLNAREIDPSLNHAESVDALDFAEELTDEEWDKMSKINAIDIEDALSTMMQP